MQPPRDTAHLGPLPEAQPEFHVANLVKRYKYIALILTPQTPGEGNPRITFACHLHQNEARKLARALLEAADAPIRSDFVDQGWFGVEGISLGGPPRRDQLVEFNPSLLGRRTDD